MRSEGEAAAEDGELKESPEAELWIPSMAAPPANVNGVEAWVPGDSVDATQPQERSREMNRHRWFLTVMAMVVGVALAGPAMGTNHETMPAPHLKPKVMPVPIKPKLTEKLQPSAAKALLGVVSIRLHNDKGPGDPSFFNEASISNEFKLALTQGGYYTAIVTYKNVSTATGVKTGTLVVKNALSGWTIIKIEQSTPSIAPNKEGSVGFLLGPIGGTVSNPVQINITAGVK